jgi:hypothetical protein
MCASASSDLPRAAQKTATHDVSVLYSGTGGAIGGRSKNRRSCSDAISIRILHVRTLLAARFPLILKVNVMGTSKNSPRQSCTTP